jgi:hypothetical protein
MATPARDAAIKAAHGYAAAINALDLPQLIALFATDATLVHPFGVFSGHDKLSEFYGGLVIPAKTHLDITRTVADGNFCVIEVTGISPQAPDKPQYAIDVFEVDAQGRITNLTIYYRNFDLR